MRSIRIAGMAVASVAILSTAANAQDKPNLVVATFGGVWGNVIDKCVFKPFTEETGIGITPEPGVSAVSRSKLQQQASNPEIDVAWIDGGISELTEADGTVADLDPAKLSNLGKIVDKAVHRRANGSIYAVGAGYFGVGIAYNKDEVKEVPTSWWDLWKPEYEGKITIPSLVNSNGVPFFLGLNSAAGGDLDNVQPAIDRLKELKVSSYWEATGPAVASFQSGEAIIGVIPSTAAWDLSDQGLPIAYSAPKEGVPSNDLRVHLVKGSKHEEQAIQLIDFTIRAETSNCLAENLFVGPVLKEVKLSEKATERMPWGTGGSADNLVLFDWNKVNAFRDQYMERWNREVLP